jgi:hypothetical protein
MIMGISAAMALGLMASAGQPVVVVNERAPEPKPEAPKPKRRSIAVEAPAPPPRHTGKREAARRLRQIAKRKT